MQITKGTFVLLTTWVSNISDWVELNNLAFTITNNCLNNSVISHVELKLTSNETWLD